MTSPPPAAPAPTPVVLVIILGSLIAFSPLSIDMYLPAMPQIAREFGVSAGEVQYTLAAYFLGMAFGQCFYGPLTDRFGRKPPLYVGLTLYALASVGGAFADDITALIALRVLQALGGCAGMVVPLAVVRDLFDHRTSARVLSRLNLVMGLAPIFAPLVGTALIQLWGWRSIFLALGTTAVMALVAVHFFLAESLTAANARRSSVRGILATFGGLLRQRSYLGYVTTRVCVGAGMVANLAGTSFVLVDIYGFSPTVMAWVLGINGLGFVLGSQLNHRLLNTHHPDRVLAVALPCMAANGLLLAVTGYTGALGVIGFEVPLFCLVFLLGVVHPNTAAGAMAGQPRQVAGSAAALMGIAQACGSGSMGALMGALNDGTARPMVTIIAVGTALATVCYLVLARPGQEPAGGHAGEEAAAASQPPEAAAAPSGNAKP